MISKNVRAVIVLALKAAAAGERFEQQIAQELPEITVYVTESPQGFTVNTRILNPDRQHHLQLQRLCESLAGRFDFSAYSNGMGENRTVTFTITT